MSDKKKKKPNKNTPKLGSLSNRPKSIHTIDELARLIVSFKEGETVYVKMLGDYTEETVEREIAKKVLDLYGIKTLAVHISRNYNDDRFLAITILKKEYDNSVN